MKNKIMRIIAIILMTSFVFNSCIIEVRSESEYYEEEWIHLFENNLPYYFVENTNSNYILAGVKPDLEIMEIDSEKDIKWLKTYPDIKYPYYIEQKDNDTYLIIGIKDNNIIVLEIDLEGFIKNSNAIDITESNWVYRSVGYSLDIDKTNDGGYIIGGTDSICYSSYPDPTVIKESLLLVKLKNDGTLDWVQDYPDNTFLHEFEVTDIHQSNDGGYIILGRTPLNGYDIGLIKTDEFGNIEWKKNYGHSYKEFSRALVELDDGGYLISGILNPTSDLNDQVYWIIKTDINGEKEWDIQKDNFVTTGWYSFVDFIKRDNSGFYLFGIDRTSDDSKYNSFSISKFNNYGSEIFTTNYNFSSIQYNYATYVANSVGLSSDNDFLIVGVSQGFDNSRTGFFAKISEEDITNKIPTIHITNIVDDLLVSSIQKIQGTALDSDGDIERVEIKFNTGSWIQATGTNSWSYDWDTTSVSNGQHTIYARSYDGEEYSEILSLNVNVQNIIEEENIPPIITIIDPGDLISSITTISGTASDQDGEIQSVQIQIDSGQWITVSGTNTWSYNLDTTTMNNGYYTINVRSFDGEDYSTISSMAVNVDNIIEDENEIPVLTILSHDNQEKVDGTVTLSGSASDTEDTIQKVEIKVDNNNWVTAEGTEEWVYMLDTTVLSDGQHFIYLRAWDGSEYSEMETLTLDVNNGENDSPGFEIFLVIFCVMVLLLVKDKRRRIQ